jgi:hypothetical protein
MADHPIEVSTNCAGCGRAFKTAVQNGPDGFPYIPTAGEIAAGCPGAKAPHQHEIPKSE